MNSLRYFIEKMLQLFIFYLVLHTARSAIDFSYERDLDYQQLSNYGRTSKHHKYDQILSNIHSFNKERSAANDYSKNTDDNNGNKQELNVMLGEVTSALDKIKEELIKFNNDGILTVERPVKHEKRYKRNVNNVTLDAPATENNVTTNVTTTETPVAVTEKVEVLRVNNETVKSEDLHENNDTNSVVQRRRMNSIAEAAIGIAPPPPKSYSPGRETQYPKFANQIGTAPPPPPPPFVVTTSRVKDKLLSYLEDTFNEVERKIKPLTNIKIALSNNDHYRIGYIIATIDTLEVTLKKLKKDMNLHQHVWEEEKILDLFDRIKATNTVASSLIESLKKYLPKN